jgi:hypothetical protein
MSNILSSSAPRQRIHSVTPIAPPIAPPYQTRLDHVVGPRSHNAADQRGEHDLIRPVDGLVHLAQPPRHDRPAREEPQREHHAEGLDRDAQNVNFGLHCGSAPGVMLLTGL